MVMSICLSVAQNTRQQRRRWGRHQGCHANVSFCVNNFMPPMCSVKFMLATSVGTVTNTCSYDMNLSADSGAILSTLMPLPRHKDRTPPSINMCCRPLMRPKRFLRDPYTYTVHKAELHTMNKWLQDTGMVWHGLTSHLASQSTVGLRWPTMSPPFAVPAISGCASCEVLFSR